MVDTSKREGLVWPPPSFGCSSGRANVGIIEHVGLQGAIFVGNASEARPVALGSTLAELELPYAIGFGKDQLRLLHGLAKGVQLSFADQGFRAASFTARAIAVIIAKLCRLGARLEWNLFFPANMGIRMAEADLVRVLQSGVWQHPGQRLAAFVQGIATGAGAGAVRVLSAGNAVVLAADAHVFQAVPTSRILLRLGRDYRAKGHIVGIKLPARFWHCIFRTGQDALRPGHILPKRAHDLSHVRTEALGHMESYLGRERKLLPGWGPFAVNLPDYLYLAKLLVLGAAEAGPEAISVVVIVLPRWGLVSPAQAAAKVFIAGLLVRAMLFHTLAGYGLPPVGLVKGYPMVAIIELVVIKKGCRCSKHSKMIHIDCYGINFIFIQCLGISVGPGVFPSLYATHGVWHVNFM